MIPSSRTRRWLMLVALAAGFVACSPYEPDPTPIISPRALGSWVWQNPRPQGMTLTGVWATGLEDAWAVGAEGTLLRRDGDGWRRIDHDLGAIEFQGIWGRSSDDVIALGRTGEVLEFDGERWSAATLPDLPHGTSLLAIQGDAEGQAWICGTKGTLLESDGGDWKLVDQTPEETLVSVATAADGELFVADAEGTVHRLLEGTWSELPSAIPLLVLREIFFADDELYACGVSGAFRLGDDEEWESISLPSEWPEYTPVYSALPIEDGSVQFLGGLGLFANVRDGEMSQVNIPFSLPNDLIAGWGDGKGNALAVGLMGTLVRRTAGGNWQLDIRSSVRSSCGPGPDVECGWPTLEDLSMVGPDLGFALHTRGLVRFDGQLWMEEDLDTSESGPLHSLWADDGGNILAGGDRGLLENTQGTWTYHAASFESSRSSLWARHAGDAWWPGRDGELFHFDGTSVSSSLGPAGQEVGAVIGDGAGQLWVLARQKNLYRGVPGNWTLVDTRESQEALLQRFLAGPEGVLAVGSHVIVAIGDAGFEAELFETDSLIDDSWANDSEVFVLRSDGGIDWRSEAGWQPFPGVSRSTGARALSGWSNESLTLGGFHSRILHLPRGNAASN